MRLSNSESLKQEKNMQRLVSKAILIGKWIVLAGILVTPIHYSAAQDGKIIGGLLRDLIENEMKRREQMLRDRGVPSSLAPPRNSQYTNNIRLAQGYYTSFYNEANNLCNLAQVAAGRVPGLRNSLDELRKLAEMANAVSQNFRQPIAEPVAIDEIQSVDSQWRLSKYRLEQVSALPANIRNSMNELDRINRRCCELFNVEPRINQPEVVRLLDSLAAELRHLERDLDYAARFNANAKDSLMRLRRLGTRARLLSDSAAASERYEILVADYEAFDGEWRSLSRDLDTLNDRYVDRTVEEVRRIDAALREQLWLSQKLDRKHFQHIADAMRKNVQILMQSINLELLIALPNPAQALQSAEALDRLMKDMCECAARNSTTEDLIQHWQELDVAWQALLPSIQAINSDGIRTLIVAVDQQLEAMRQTLGLQLIFDPQQVVQYAAQLEGISEQIAFHAIQWQRQRNSNATGYAIGLANEFRNEARRFHAGCTAGKSQQQLFDQCNQVTRKWAKLQPELIKCNSNDRNSLLRLCDATTKNLAHLQALLQ